MREFSDVSPVLVLILLVNVITVYSLVLRLEHETKTLETDTLVGVVVSTRLLEALHTNFSLTRQYALSENATDRSDLESQLQASGREVEERQSQYRGTVSRAEDRQNFDGLIKATGPYFSAQRKVLDMGRNGKTTEARQAVSVKLFPLFLQVKKTVRNHY